MSRGGRLPGAWLLRLGRLAGPPSRERVLEALVADLQAEWGEAINQTSPWRARLIHLRWIAAFWQTFALDWILNLVPGLRRSWHAESGWLGPGTRQAFVRVAIASALASLPGLVLTYQRAAPGWGGDVLFFNVAPSLAVGLPMGCLFAAALANQGSRRVTARSLRRSAVLVGLVTLVFTGWLTPNSNQSYREYVADRMGLAIPHHGDRELTLEQLAARAIDSSAWRPPEAAEFHKRLAVPVSCLVLAIVGLAISGRSRHFAVRLPLALVVCAFYYSALRLGESAADSGRVPPFAAIWLPLGSLAAAGLMALRGPERDSHQTAVSGQ